MKTQTEELLQRRVEREQSEQRLPSVVGGLIRDGSLVWSGGAGQVGGGPPDANVQYRCGSITKTFVAVQIMRLRDEGLLSVTDPLELHLPGAFDGVTIAQLLSHSSGLRAETAGPWWERTTGGDFADLLAHSLTEPLGSEAIEPNPVRLARPGRRFHYTNVGFAILGELVSRKRGAPWEETVQTELLTPLGMTRSTMRPSAPHASGFAVHPYADLLLPEPEHHAGAMAPAGQLWTTVADLARWMAFLAGNPTPGSDQPILAVSTLEEMREPLAVDNRRGEAWTGAHGLGLQVWNSDGERAFGHGGSMPGFLAIMAIDAQSGDGSIIMANSTSGLRPALGDDLESILKDNEPRPFQPWVPEAPAPDLLDALGRWFWVLPPTHCGRPRLRNSSWRPSLQAAVPRDSGYGRTAAGSGSTAISPARRFASSTPTAAGRIGRPEILSLWTSRLSFSRERRMTRQRPFPAEWTPAAGSSQLPSARSGR